MRAREWRNTIEQKALELEAKALTVIEEGEAFLLRKRAEAAGIGMAAEEFRQLLRGADAGGEDEEE